MPLSGLRVLEVGEGIALAYCGKLLAGLGAEVIKVEPPGGDSLRRMDPFVDDAPGGEASLLFLYLNTGKLGVTLDICRQTARQVLERLTGEADILIESIGAGRLEHMGLGYEQLTERNPGLIVTSISHFSDGGPYSSYQASDLVLLALGGLLNMVGDPDREPVRLGGYQAYMSAGLSAFTGTLVALTYRDGTGEGQRVVVSAHETMAYMEWKSPTYYQIDGRVRHRGGQSQWTVIRCADGFIAFVYQDKNWPAVIRLVGDERLTAPRFADRKGRLANREELQEILEGWSLKRTKLETYHAAQALGIPAGMVATPSDLLESPQLQVRGFFTTVDHPSTGPALYPGLPLTVQGVRPVLGRAPLLGEHNEEVYLNRAGLTEHALARLRHEGMV